MICYIMLYTITQYSTGYDKYKCYKYVKKNCLLNIFLFLIRSCSFGHSLLFLLNVYPCEENTDLLLLLRRCLVFLMKEMNEDLGLFGLTLSYDEKCLLF